MTILNWGSSVGNRTIDTSGFFLIPETEAQRFARTGVALPANLAGLNDFGLGFQFRVDPTSGDGTFLLDANGLKRSSGFVPYSAPASGIDILEAVGYPPGVLSSGVYINALDLTTIRMGDGSDFFSVTGPGITQSIRADVNIDASQGYIFQSSIFAGAGDDTVSVLMPWQSVFKGGDNTLYFDAVFGTDPGGGTGIILDEDLTLEEVRFGDLIVLKGSRFDWDIEFKDGNGDGIVTLESILDERDYLAVSNNNQISGFERILFGDILFDLVLYRQQESSAVFGQPDYYLNGLEALAPELNSDIASGSELWEAFRFNRTKLQGITGTATDQTEVFTGDANDTPFLVGALRFASLNTEAGNDIVEIGTPGQTAVEDASIDLGSGTDQLKVNGLFTRSSVFGGADADNIILSTITNSSVDGGTGNDVVQVTTSASQSRFDGGDDRDVLLLPGTFASYLLTSSNEAGIVTFNDAFGNSITGFETIRFSDINLDALQALSLSGPPTPVNEGASASYTIALSNSGLASGDSVAFSLQLSDGTAQFSADLAALVQGSLQAAAGIVLSNVIVNAGTGLIRAVASASRGFSTGATIATLNLPVSVDLQNEPAETFTVTLADFVQAQTVTTTISNVLPVTIRLNGPASITEGQTASYAVVLDGVGLADGRSVTFSLDSASGTASEGTDFATLIAASLQKADGITLGGISTAADGTVTVTAANTSGAALAVGATLLTLQLPITTDSVVEGNESFGVTLASSTAVVSSGVVTTTINDLVPTPTIALTGQASVVEGQSAAYAVSMGGSGLLAGQSITLTLDSASGTALEGVDFAALTAGGITPGAGVTLSGISTDPVTKAVTLTATNSSGATLAAGAQLLSVSVPTTADLFSESAETFAVSLSSASATVSAGSITTTITDNDLLAVRIAGPASVAEGSTTSPYTISLGSGVGLGAGASVSFSIDTASGTATEGADFAALEDSGLTAASGISLVPSTAGDGTITVIATNTGGADLEAGSALASIGIATSNDLIVEANETFSLNLAGGAGVTVEGPASVVTTISDDDAPALKLTGSTSVEEGASAAYALALDGVGLGVGRSVDFLLSTLEGTATEGIDFASLIATNLQPVTGVRLSNISTGVSGIISGRATNIGDTELAVNAELLTFSIAAAADAVAELPETYDVLLSSIDADVSTARFTTTITDPSLPVIRLTGSTAVAEGSPATYGVSLDGGIALGTGRSVTITLDTAGISATEGRDFAALVAASIKPTPLGITLSNISTDPLTQAVTLTATNTNLVLDLDAGSQLLSFELPTTADLFSEGPETFAVSLTSSNATVSAGSITTTINDNDALAIKLTGSADVAEGAIASYSVSLDGVGLGAGRSVSFTLNSASGTATQGLDFAALTAAALNPTSGITLSPISTAADGSIAVTATNTSGTDLVADATLLNFATATVADAFVEGNETFGLTLTSSSATVSAGLVTTTITDDDASALKLTGSATVAEGAAASYALALDGVGLGVGRSVTFTLDSASGTATEGVDFAALTAAALNPATGITLSGISTAANGAITATATNNSGADLAAGFEILSFSLAANADSIAEGSESYSVSLAGDNGSGTVSTAITDGNAAVIRLDGSASVLEGENASYAVSLAGVGLGAGQSVTLTLDSAGDSATEGDDFAALSSSDLIAGADVTLSGISTDPISKAVTLTATNTSGASLAAGSQLLSFSVGTTDDFVTESDENFNISLTSPNASVSQSLVQTTIRNRDVPGVVTPRFFTQNRSTPAPQKLIGTNKADRIIGGNGRDLLIGGRGVDRLVGGPGEDTFQRSYNDRKPDKLIDFEPGVDNILITDVPRDSYTGKWISRQRRLLRNRIVRNVSSKSAAQRSATPFAYDRDTGRLYLNANGKKSGFGSDGGLIGRLPTGLTLRHSDIEVNFADPLA